jgi:hypothetical protein
VAAASRVLPSFLAIACGSSLQRVQQEAHPPSESAIHTYMLIYSCGSILQAAKAIQQAACWSVLADGGRFRGKENVATLAVASNGTCVVLGCPTVPDNYAKVWDAAVHVLHCAVCTCCTVLLQWCYIEKTITVLHIFKYEMPAYTFHVVCKHVQYCATCVCHVLHALKLLCCGAPMHADPG